MDRRIALVTGASRGIGREIALQLARDGFFVIINYHENRVSAEETLEAVISESGAGIILGFDVSKRTEVETAIKRLNRDHGAVDVLINNAGIIRDHPLMRMRNEDWDHVVLTNLTGVFNVTRAVVKTWAGGNRGKRIVNITSVAGETGNAYQTNYSASKGGIISFTKSLARELGHKDITVNAVAPGYIVTEGTAHLDKDQIISQIPLGRFGLPFEVARTVSFLVTEKAGYITGQVIRVNGGLYM